MPYTPVLATLGYILSPDAARVLMVHRNRHPADHHFGKYNGLGGKLEPAEDVFSGMAREIREEAAIDCVRLELRGTISWPGFGKHGEDWFGFLFRIPEWTGTPPATNAEGALEWVPLADVRSKNLWEGDRFFIDLIFDADPRPFHGVMPYADGRPQSWSVRRD